MTGNTAQFVAAVIVILLSLVAIFVLGTLAVLTLGGLLWTMRVLL